MFRFVSQSRYGGNLLCGTVGSICRFAVACAFFRVSFLSPVSIVACVACCTVPDCMSNSSLITTLSRRMYMSYVSRCSFHETFQSFSHAVFSVPGHLTWRVACAAMFLRLVNADMWRDPVRHVIWCVAILYVRVIPSFCRSRSGTATTV